MTYVVLARWTARPGNEQLVQQTLTKLVQPSLDEQGCRAYRPLRSDENPCVFLIYEEYDDEAGYAAHAASDHFRRYALEEGIPLLESRERMILTPIDPTG